MKHICVFTFMLGMALLCGAETLTGIVMDQKSKPKKNVRIELLNSTKVYFTDAEGRFTIDRLIPTDTLEFFVANGKKAVVPVGNLRNIVMNLGKTECSMDVGSEILIFPYQKVPMQRRNPNILTYEDIQKTKALDIYDLLRGSFSGVNVIGNSIRIRGNSTVNGNPEPLFVIDGQEYERSSDISSAVSVNEIYSIEVNKMGNGYGVKGANGVIVITTISYAKNK